MSVTRNRHLRRLGAASAVLALAATVLTALTVLPGAARAQAAPAGEATTLAATATTSATPGRPSSAPAGCNTAPKGHPATPHAQCFAMLATGSDGKITADATGPRPGALGPADIQSAYHLPATGQGQTVAIVDAFGDSRAESDLAVLRSYYGLPPCTSDNGCFQKVDQDGGTDYPVDDAGWAAETALDLAAVSAACPNCHMLLVEGNDTSFDSLGTAVDTAVRLGAKYVSNSYGVPGEFAGEQAYDHYYDHPGVAVLASSGDTGDVTNWPATNPKVVSVGGTSLTRDDSPRAWHESAWGSAGSGCSPFEPKPSYQGGIATACSNRAIADVSAVADPATGLAVYDTLGQPGWLQMGGTSLSSPLLAAMYALAGTPVPNSYPVTYPYQRAGSLFDVTDGTNGSCGDVLCTAGPGWDGPTGLGTPNGVTALSTGETGELAGTVTDKGSGAPIAGATLTAAPGGFSATSGADGSYDFAIPVGEYDLTARAYGYTAASATGLTVANGQKITTDLALASVPNHTVSGTVTDGSGHGWPLYARITVDGYPGDPIYTDPYTGRYSVSLPEQAGYDLHVNAAALPGYAPTTTHVDLGTADATVDLTLAADTATCVAPGYGYDGTTETFTGWRATVAQDGWTNVDNVGAGAAWQFDNPMTLSPPAGGDSDFAAVEPAANPFETHQDTTLISPVFDLSAQAQPQLGFDTEYDGYADQSADVDLSVDGGTTWTSVWHQDATSFATHVDLPIPAAAGQAAARVRFHFAGTSETSNSIGWLLDNVFVGTRTCVAHPGGLVAGLVTDDNTGDPVNGATVAASEGSGVSATTPDDANLADGFYWLESPATGNQELTVTDGKYTAATATVDVPADGIVRQDWQLRAGHLTASPGDVSASVALGASTTRKVTLTNDGTAPIHVRLGEQHAGVTPMATRPGAGAPLQRVKVSGHLDPFGLKGHARTAAAVAPAAGTAWAGIADYPLPVTNNAVASDGGTVYSVGGIVGPGEFTAAAYAYDPVAQRWNQIESAPYAIDGGTAAFLDGKLYVIGGLRSNFQATSAVYVYDPVAATWTRSADLPQALGLGRAAVLDGKLYVVGGCLDAGCHVTNTTYRYDPATGAWTSLAHYPLAVATGACAGISGEVVCTGGSSTPDHFNLSETYLYHPGTNTWTRGADLPYPDWGMAYSGANGKLQIAAGFSYGAYITNQAVEYDPVRNVWTALPNAAFAEEGGGSACGLVKVGGDYTFPGGTPQPFAERLAGYDQCAPDVNWLSESTSSLDLAPGASATVTIAVDTTALSQPGDYLAALWTDTDTPYQLRPVGVTTHVTPPSSWGKVTGTVTDATTAGPLAGATVVICTMYDPASGACGPVTYTLRTDRAGQVQLWLDRGYSPLQVSAAKNGYRPRAKLVKITAGATATVTFSLTRS